MSVVALRSNFPVDRYFEISSSMIGDLPEEIKSILFLTISIAIMPYFLEINTAKERPTYPVPITDIFIIIARAF